MIISINGEKLFDIIQHKFIIKILSIVGIKENFLNLMKYTCKKAIANMTFNVEKLDISFTKTETKISMSLITLHINIVIEDPDSTIRQQEGMKDVQTGKEELKLSLFTNDIVVYIKK